jgi:hypothetical protein
MLLVRVGSTHAIQRSNSKKYVILLIGCNDTWCLLESAWVSSASDWEIEV